jgi:hypothetical protein
MRERMELKALAELTCSPASFDCLAQETFRLLPYAFTKRIPIGYP